MDLMRTNVLSIAATAAAMLDPEVHQKIRTRTDQDAPDYKKLESELRRARDANRRRDLYVKYIYSMRPYPQDPRSEYSYVAARSRFPFEPAGEIPIKGKTESVRTYTIRNFA